MDISQAVAVRFWWKSSKTKFNMSVWLNAKLSFWKICGAEIQADQGFTKLSLFSNKFKSEESRRVECVCTEEWSMVMLVRWEFVHQKLCAAECIEFEGSWCKIWIFGEIRNWSNFGKSDRCEHVVPTGAALPGAHILTDVHPTNGERSNSMACKYN